LGVPTVAKDDERQARIGDRYLGFFVFIGDRPKGRGIGALHAVVGDLAYTGPSSSVERVRVLNHPAA
jgi:hypothetical protein